MPIPKPNAGESQSDYIARCMGVIGDDPSYESQDQRIAACENTWRQAQQSENEEYVEVVANLGGRVRTETLMGREYVVVPGTIVRSEIVLRNNLGRTMLPAADVTEAWAETWNSAPVLADHPTRHGAQASGRDPAIQNELGIGALFRVKAENGSLVGDVFLDPSRKDAVPDLAVILKKLNNGDSVEVSTGFPVSVEMANGERNGELFEKILHPAGADHLAVFASKIGACSVTKGCGLAANHEGECEIENVVSQARTPKYSGTESGDWTKPTLADYVAGLDLGDVSSIADLTAEQKSRIAAHSLLGDPSADTFDQLSFFPVVNPRTGKLNANALRAVLGGRGSQADIPADAKTSAQNKARSLLESKFAAQSASSFWERSRTAIYRLLFGKDPEDAENQSDEDKYELIRNALQAQYGGPKKRVWVAATYSDEGLVVFEVWDETAGQSPALYQTSFEMTDSGEVALGEDAKKVRRVTTFEPVAMETADDDSTKPPEGSMNREQMIAHLVEAGTDRAALEALSDCQVKTLFEASNAQPANNEGEPRREDNPDAFDRMMEYRRKAENLEAQFGPAQRALDQRRTEQLDELLYRADNLAWSSEELKAMDGDQIDKIYRSVFGQKAHVGNGGPRVSQTIASTGSFDFVKPIMGGRPGESVLSEREAN